MVEFFRETHDKISVRKRGNLDFPPHIHNDFEMIFLKSGSVDIFCNGEEISLKSGEIFLCFPDQVHYYKNTSDPCDSVFLLISPLKLPHTSSYLENNNCAFIHCSCDGDIEQQLYLALKDINNEDSGSYLPHLISYIILKIISQNGINQAPQTNEIISKILDYCNSHFREGITLKSTSKVLNISESHISHTFTNKLKMSFSNYINFLRLNYAQNLLVNSNYSITEIAFMSGYNTIRSFNRAFFKQNNITPRNYRSININKAKKDSL